MHRRVPNCTRPTWDLKQVSTKKILQKKLGRPPKAPSPTAIYRAIFFVHFFLNKLFTPSISPLGLGYRIPTVRISS